MAVFLLLWESTCWLAPALERCPNPGISHGPCSQVVLPGALFALQLDPQALVLDWVCPRGLGHGRAAIHLPTGACRVHGASGLWHVVNYQSYPITHRCSCGQGVAGTPPVGLASWCT